MQISAGRCPFRSAITDAAAAAAISSQVTPVGTWPKPYSADDAKCLSQALGMSASRHPRNMVWAMFRQRRPRNNVQIGGITVRHESQVRILCRIARHGQVAHSI
jgi:hypothetical protein